MDKERFDNALMGYLYRELTPPEEEAFLAHCKNHPEAMKELEALGGVRKVLAQAAPLPDPPSAITARILDQARQAVPSKGSVASQKAAQGAQKAQGLLGWLAGRPWVFGGLAAAGAGAAAILVIGTANLSKLSPSAATAPAVGSAPRSEKNVAAAPTPAAQPPMEAGEAAGAAGDEPALAGKRDAARKRTAQKPAYEQRDNDDVGMDLLKADKRSAAPLPVVAQPASNAAADVAAPKLALEAKTAPQPERAAKKADDFRGDTGTLQNQRAAHLSELPPADTADGLTRGPRGGGGSAAGAGLAGAASTTEKAKEGMSVGRLEAVQEAQAPRKPAADPAAIARPMATSPLMTLPPRPQNKDQAAMGSPGNAAPPPPPAEAPAPSTRAFDEEAPMPPPAKGTGMKIAKAEREEKALASPERRRMEEDFKKLKGSQDAMKAQSELTVATEQLASDDPQTALQMFKRAEALDQTHELAPNPRVGQAVSLARLKRCQEAAVIVRGVRTQYPRFSKLPGVLEEVAQCYDRINDAASAAAVRAEARVAQANTTTVDPVALSNRAASIGRQVRADPRAVAGCEMTGTSAGELPRAAGVYNIALTVNAQGIPTDVVINAPKPAPQTQQCLETLLRMQRYIPGPDAQKVDLTLVLQAHAAGGGTPAAAEKARSKQAPAADTSTH